MKLQLKKAEAGLQTKRWKERGNVLFLILIAVALFAALSYAVTQSTRSSGGDAGKETNKINSAQLTQYPASVRTSIVRMIIAGQDVDTLEFNSASNFTDCTEDPVGLTPPRYPRCVFHPTGGGATAAQAPGAVMASGSSGDWAFNGKNEIENIGTTTAGDGSSAATADLIAFLPNVAKGVCESINEELGLPTDIADITEDDIEYEFADTMYNDGSTPTSMPGDGGSIGDASDPANNPLTGQPFGCFYDTDGNADAAGPIYVYYHVLVER